jgi:hypothetical protein
VYWSANCTGTAVVTYACQLLGIEFQQLQGILGRQTLLTAAETVEAGQIILINFVQHFGF